MCTRRDSLELLPCVQSQTPDISARPPQGTWSLQVLPVHDHLDQTNIEAECNLRWVSEWFHVVDEVGPREAGP